MTAVGRVEARITLAAGISATFTDSGGPTVVTITAGNYYPVEFVAAVDAQLGVNWTITPSDGEGGTGLCTINSSGTPWSITWTSTTFRDILGFAGNIAGVSVAQTGTKHCKGLWLPGATAKFTLHGDGDAGKLVTTNRQTVGPTGTVHGLGGGTHYRHDNIRWDGVPAARAKEHREAYVGESFEAFFRDCMTARLSYIPFNPYVRFYWSADVDASYAVGRLLWPSEFDVATLVQGWTGRYVVNLPPLVVEG